MLKADDLLSAAQDTIRDAPDAVALQRRPIGVFDSGIGGLSVLRALQTELPHERFVYFADTAHAPYGERDDEHVVSRSMIAARGLVQFHDIKALVVACNTATAAAIHLLRDKWPHIPVIGVEPALKPAAASSRTGHVAVLATRSTLQSAKFMQLHTALRAQAQFHLVPCDGLASAIEHDDTAQINALSEQYMRAAGPFGMESGQVDTVVLGCTHYPFVEPLLRAHAPMGLRFVDTGTPVAQQTRRMLTLHDQLQPVHVSTAPPVLLSSGDPDVLAQAAARWLRPANAPIA